MAEFDDPTTLVAATERAHDEGYRHMDAYSPFPIEELHEALGSPPSHLPLIVLSLSRDFLPSSWGRYAPTFWDWSTLLGTIGLFVALLFLFLRFLPMISIFEIRTLLPEARVSDE